MTKFNYSERAFYIGNQTAENDWAILRDHFVEIHIHNVLGRSAPSIILGRKGSGKSALRMRFERTLPDNQKAFSLQPSYDDLHGIFEYIVDVETKSFSVEFVSRLWELATLINLAGLVLRDKKKDPLPAELRRLPKELISDLSSAERYGIGRTLNLIKKSFSTDDRRAGLARTLREFLRLHIVDKDTRYFVLIDSIDDALHNSLDTTKRADLFATFFEGLLSFVRSFSNQERNPLAEYVFINVFIPLDIYDWAVNRHADHLRQYKHQVSWTQSQLSQFIASRLLRNLQGAAQVRFTQIANADARIAEVWETFFPKRISSVAFAREKIVRYEIDSRIEFINMTLRRPRDLQEIVRLVAEDTQAAKLDFPTNAIIFAAMNRYSVELRQSVEKEYEMAIPQISDILSRLSGKPPLFDKSALMDLIGDVVGHDEPVIKRSMRILYEACVLGVKKERDNSNFVTFYYDFQDFNSIMHNEQFAIHKAFWHSMQMYPSRLIGGN